MPAVWNPIDVNGAPLEADDFVICSANLATRSKRNQGLILIGGNFEFLQNLQVGIFCIQDGMTTIANDGDRTIEGSDRERGPAARTVQCLDLRFDRRHLRAHDQPSKVRRFLSARLSKSTISPR